MAVRQSIMTALMEVAVDDRHLHEDCLERDRGLLVSDCVAANLNECQRAIRSRMRWKPSGAVSR